MSVTVDVTEESLSLVTDEQTIGIWSLRDIHVDPQSDGFHLKIDGDEAILSVADAPRFASELKLDRQARPFRLAEHDSDSATSRSSDGSRIEGRIGGLGHEDQLADTRRQIDDLRSALSDPYVPPAIVFSRWLSLLKILNRRLAQGTLPQPLFFRLNSELLDLMPTPSESESSQLDPDRGA